MIKFAIVLIISILGLGGCSQKKSNIGLWTKINQSYIDDNQFESDRDYCDGKSRTYNIPIYIPASLQSSFKINGTFNSYNTPSNTFTSNSFSGNLTPVQSSATAFSSGFMNGYAMMQRSNAIEASNKAFNSCMVGLGWEKINKVSDEFEEKYFDYHETYHKDHMFFILDKQFKNTIGTYYYNYDVGDIAKVKKFIDTNTTLKNKYKDMINDMESFVNLKADSSVTGKTAELLGSIYFDGIVVDRDIKKAVTNHIISADNGNYKSYEFLADLYENGYIWTSFYRENGFDEKYKNKRLYYIYNSKLASQYIKKDIEQKVISRIEIKGNEWLMFHSYIQTIIKARYKIGSEYIKGENVEPDEKVGFEYIKNAAEFGYPPAQLELSLFYHSKGLNDKAKYWILQSIESKNRSNIFYQKIDIFDLKNSMKLFDKSTYYKKLFDLDNELNISSDSKEVKQFYESLKLFSK